MIGLWLSLEFCEPFLKIGITSPNLKTVGKVSSLKDALKERWRTSERISA